MKNIMDKNVDAEMFASLCEEENSFCIPAYKRMETKTKVPPGREDTIKYNASYWAKKFSGASTEESLTDKAEHIASDLGNTSGKKKEEGVLGKITGWISENPGTALLAALVVGGGAYMLYKHLHGKSSSLIEKTGKTRRPRRSKAASQPEKEVRKEKDSESRITGEEIALGVAAAAGGALAGTMMQEYSLAAAVPAGVLGIAKNNIPLIATAVGLILGYGIRKLFPKTWEESEVKTDKKLEAEGYVKTLTGYFKPQKEPFKSI